MAICTEFDSVVYVCDVQAYSLTVCTEVKLCSLFLNAMGSLYNAFSVHNKGSTYTVKTPDEALILVQQCQDFLNDIHTYIHTYFIGSSPRRFSESILHYKNYKPST